MLLPAGVSHSPMTYMANGKQYIVVAVSAGISWASWWRSLSRSRGCAQRERK
jgi:hypothetical protein